MRPQVIQASTWPVDEIDVLQRVYDRIRRTVVAHVFGERTLATLERLLGLLSAFEVVVWMTDGWPLYESRLKGKLPRYQQALYSAH